MHFQRIRQNMRDTVLFLLKVGMYILYIYFFIVYYHNLSEKNDILQFEHYLKISTAGVTDRLSLFHIKLPRHHALRI